MRKPYTPISRPVGVPPIGNIAWCGAAGEYVFYPNNGAFLLAGDIPFIQQNIVMMNAEERGRQMKEDRREVKVEPEKPEWTDPKERLPGIGEQVVWKMKETGTEGPWTTSGHIQENGWLRHGSGVTYPSMALGWQPMPKPWTPIETAMPGIYEKVEWKLKGGATVVGDCGKCGTINLSTGKTFNLHDVDAWRKL